MNTRLQVEHGVTEMIFPGLDIVELMIMQGIAEHSGGQLESERLKQDTFSEPTAGVHVVEARIYCENPVQKFAPSPGVLQYVEFPENAGGLRIDTWVWQLLSPILVADSYSMHLS
jgi:acetyl/propionyl-CoA carboxylase alpha subunit